MSRISKSVLELDIVCFNMVNGPVAHLGEHLICIQGVAGSSPVWSTKKDFCMPMYETTVRTPKGEEKKRIFADTPQEAKKLFEQLYGGPRNVPYIPHTVPS